MSSNINFYDKITISDDHCSGSSIEKRKLLALNDSDGSNLERVNTEMSPFEKYISDSSSLARDDYIGTGPSIHLDSIRNELSLPGPHWGSYSDDEPRRLLQLNSMKKKLEKLEESNKNRFLFRTKTADSSANSLTASSREDRIANPSQSALLTQRKSSGLELQTVEMDLRNLLQGANISHLHLQKLQEYIESLQSNTLRYGVIKEEEPSFRYQIFYCILNMESGVWEKKKSLPYFDHPLWVRGEGKTTSRIRCEMPLRNFDLYLEQNKDVAFIVYRNFETGFKADVGFQNISSRETAHLPQHESEDLQPVNKDLITAITILLSSRREFSQLLEEFSQTERLSAPYLFIYHSRTKLKELKDSLTLPVRTQLSLFSKYVIEQYAEEYAAVDELLSRNKILPEYVHYLFKPGDILVSRIDSDYIGYLAATWPRLVEADSAISESTGLPPDNLQDAEVFKAIFSIKAWHWVFDGNFQREWKTLQLKIPNLQNTCNSVIGVKSIEKQSGKPRLESRTTDIADLDVFPIQYASKEIIERCRRRGKNFWKCRHRRYVSYREIELEGFNTTNDRYMIDLKTYRTLHPDDASPLKDQLGPEVMAQDEPPDEQFEFLLPLTIQGYNLRRKKWYDLLADRIEDVRWNKEAFTSLVIDRKASDLIRALVTHQLAAEKGTDLIRGKGNGLILLLHGGPGTGKTLTAEGVAEMAEKPLYRVTCGDVGIKADEVEKYLESVMHLGKIWGCVVLLDEAEVFLEQRSLEDLERNALVSVFLRVLEYYEGILVLTSNRVGTFDEAFKSRIQLALHYPRLGPYQRLRIWENFINRLESFEDDGKVDIADMRDHLEDLKEEEMNGRQIRNVITTARQYAEWKGTTLTYAQLKDVIEVSGRFDKYLTKLHGGFTQDQLAQDEGFRLA